MENYKHSLSKPISEWHKLLDDELEAEIKKVIQGFGMAGSTQFLNFIPEYYEKIKNTELKARVNQILCGLINDIESGVGERAIYICSNLRLEKTKEKILEIIKRSDSIFEKIKRVATVEDCGRYISYIGGLNAAIGILKITEAKEFLIKQLEPLKKPVPPPLTKEFYLYYESAQSALSALKSIEPVLAKEYEDGVSRQ